MNEMAPLARATGGVGQSVRHDSAVGHVTGRATYIDDMPTPAGLLHAALILSPHAHARIKSVNKDKALAVPGVVAVVMAEDVPGHNDIGPILKNEPALAPVAEYVGHPVGAVAAHTREAALKAARLVEIEWEVLPAVLSLDEAVAQELLVAPRQVMQRGDIANGLASAAKRIKGEIRCGGQDHFYLETHIALAIPGEGEDITIHSSTQHPSEVQHGVAHVLGLPFSAVTVEVRRMGGGFGGKESQATIIAAAAALLAWKTRRPVKLRLSRDDDMQATGKRHDFLIRYEMGVDGEGRITALDMMFAANGGNIADLTPSVLTRALCHADNCYFIPNARFIGLPCKTNTVSNTAFRGFGGPQGMFGIETVMDHCARELGLPLDEFRRRNVYGKAERNITPYGQEVEDNVIPETLDALEREASLEAWRAEVKRFNETSPVIKKGLATMPIKFGISFNLPSLNQAGALVHVYRDGSVLLNHGGTEMGQGLFIKVAQVVAEVFKIDISQVRITATSTAKVPNTAPTAASTGSDLNGMAAFNAATEIRGRMAAVAAEHFEVEPAEVVFADGRVGAGNRSMSFGELAELTWRKRVSLSAEGYYRTPKIHWNFENLQGRPFYYFSYGAAAAEVAVDTLTGESRVLRVEIVQDTGHTLNPAIDLGQIEGAFVQGMGWLTCEELKWDEKGRLRTHGPSTYKIPGSRDVPPIFNVKLLSERPNREETVYRSKAIGEPPLMLAIAVHLAIKDAVASLADNRLTPKLDAPATAERVLFAIDDLLARAGGPH